jgi:uncharacterized protein (DUF488 family)
MSLETYQPVFTIGHSNHELTKFVALLKQHGIQAVADVRSSPYSQFNPHFNREALEGELRRQDIAYVFLGAELGARRSERECYVKGRADYALISRTTAFARGIDRLIQGAARMRISLMCAEKDPLDCHRCILVSPHIRQHGLKVFHILADGTLETHEQTEARLLRKFELPERELFRSTAEIIAGAYQIQSEKIAYQEEEPVLREDPPLMEIELFTIGFTQTSARNFFTTLKDAGVKRIVDVRLNNNSQLAGFSKKEDLAYFLEQIAGIEYIHLPDLAPTQDILDDFKKHKGDWRIYERKFLELIAQREIEKKIDPLLLQNGCLLCSEHLPHHCHRRLVAEYLNAKWGGIKTSHLI